MFHRNNQQKLYVNNTSRWRMNTHDINPRLGRRPTPTHLSHVYLHLPPRGHGVYYLPTPSAYTTLLLRLISLVRFPPSSTNTRIRKDESKICLHVFDFHQVWNAYKDIDGGTLNIFAIHPVFSYALNVCSFNLTLINIKHTTANTQGYYILILK